MICDVVETAKVKVRGFTTTAAWQNRLCPTFSSGTEACLCAQYFFYVNRESRGTTPKGEGFYERKKKFNLKVSKIESKYQCEKGSAWTRTAWSHLQSKEEQSSAVEIKATSIMGTSGCQVFIAYF